MTILFNVFVYYTLFNQINCRVIDDSFNIFIRMNKSLLFPLICFVEMALQAIIIEFGNEALHVVERGLTLNQWGFTLLFSCITFFISIIVKIIPFEKVIDKILDRRQSEKDRKHEEEIMKKHKILNEDAQSIDSIKDSRVVIHKKVLNYDRNDETKTHRFGQSQVFGQPPDHQMKKLPLHTL